MDVMTSLKIESRRLVFHFASVSHDYHASPISPCHAPRNPMFPRQSHLIFMIQSVVIHMTLTHKHEQFDHMSMTVAV